MAAINSLTSIDHYDMKTYNALQSETGIAQTVREIKSSSGSLYGFILHNNDAAIRFVQFYWKPASEVVPGTTPPDFTVLIGASGSVALTMDHPVRDGTGLSVTAATTETGTTAPTAAVTGQVLFK